MKPPEALKAVKSFVILKGAKLVTVGSTAWDDEPLSSEKLWTDPHYRRWARENYSLRTLTRLLVTKRRKEGHQETREETFKAIAKLLGVDNWKKVKYAANRSSKVISKRRQQI